MIGGWSFGRGSRKYRLCELGCHIVLMSQGIRPEVACNLVPLHAFIDIVIKLFVRVGSAFGVVIFAQRNSRTVLVAEQVRNTGLFIALVRLLNSWKMMSFVGKKLVTLLFHLLSIGL